MRLNDFDYELPEGLIAQHPTQRRDDARLMVLDRNRQSISHDVFRSINRYLPEQSLLVINNSKVVPARLLGRRQNSGGQVEVFLLRELSPNRYEALLKPLKKIKVGEPLEFGQGVVAVLEDKDKRIVSFNKKNMAPFLDKIGHIPLPPYISRLDDKSDKDEYQTVYARHRGSVASPTAGLHFTKPLMTKLRKAGHAFAAVTLHINYGTFKPVECEDITEHSMHSEEYCISSPVFRRVQEAHQSRRNIIAVGTTSCRVLESVAQTKKLAGSTNIFIYPGYEFQMMNCLLTNFHLPKSTLLMLVSAFGGMDFIKNAYREAIREKYRFYSYGDAMLII